MAAREWVGLESGVISKEGKQLLLTCCFCKLGYQSFGPTTNGRETGSSQVFLWKRFWGSLFHEPAQLCRERSVLGTAAFLKSQTPPFGSRRLRYHPQPTAGAAFARSDSAPAGETEHGRDRASPAVLAERWASPQPRCSLQNTCGQSLVSLIAPRSPAQGWASRAGTQAPSPCAGSGKLPRPRPSAHKFSTAATCQEGTKTLRASGWEGEQAGVLQRGDGPSRGQQEQVDFLPPRDQGARAAAGSGSHLPRRRGAASVAREPHAGPAACRVKERRDAPWSEEAWGLGATSPNASAGSSGSGRRLSPSPIPCIRC